MELELMATKKKKPAARRGRKPGRKTVHIAVMLSEEVRAEVARIADAYYYGNHSFAGRVLFDYGLDDVDRITAAGEDVHLVHHEERANPVSDKRYTNTGLLVTKGIFERIEKVSKAKFSSNRSLAARLLLERGSMIFRATHE